MVQIPNNHLACPSPAPAALPSGTIKLFRDNNWQSSSYTISLNDYTSGRIQSISGTSMQDQATWVSFNLPVGTVVTLMDNVPSSQNSNIADQSGYGRCVDLIGTGTTTGISLIDANMNDCVSAFFWRTVDLNQGAIVLYQDANFSGSRSAIFLSEWAANTVFSISNWYLQDRVSSITWETLQDRQSVRLFNNADGSGNTYDNVKGWGSTKSISNLTDVGFNDVMSAFLWTGLAPKKEIIAPFTMNLTFPPGGSTALTQTTDYSNNTDKDQSFTASLSNTDAQTLTVTSTESTTTTFEMGYEQSWEVSEVGVKAGGKLTLKLSNSYTQSKSSTTSVTKTVALNFSTQVTAAAHKATHATVIAQIGKVPQTSYQTTAQRWYDQPVTGSVQDMSNNGWWLRTEVVTGYITGGLACSTNVQVTTSDLS